MLAGEEERTRLARPAGCVRAYSIASIPPQDEPNRWMSAEAEAVAHCLDLGTNSSTVQKSAGFSIQERPQPIWS